MEEKRKWIKGKGKIWTHVIDFLINLVHFFFYHSIQTVSPLYKIGEHSLSDKASPLYDPVSDSNTHPGIHFLIEVLPYPTEVLPFLTPFLQYPMHLSRLTERLLGKVSRPHHHPSAWSLNYIYKIKTQNFFFDTKLICNICSFFEAILVTFLVVLIILNK